MALRKHEALAFAGGRAVFEMRELDAGMSLATVGVFTLGGLAYLASQNVAASPEIATRMWGFGPLSSAQIGSITSIRA